MADELNVVTLEEGNTPLYHLPRCGKSLGVERLFAKHQGMNPTGSFKDTGMTAALSVAHERGIPMGGVRFDGKYFGLDGGVRGTRGDAIAGADP